MFLNRIQNYLKNSPESSIFIIDQSIKNLEIEDIVTKLNYVYIYLDGEEIHTSADFWAQIQDKMRFPSYFGHNWDALLDCITDLSWYESKRFFIYYENFSNFAERDEEQFVTALKTLKYAIMDIDENTTLMILISGKIHSLPSLILSPIFTDLK